MSEGGEARKGKGTVLYRPAEAKGAEPKGTRVGGCALFVSEV